MSESNERAPVGDGQCVNALHLAAALESADWSNVSIGNKCMILGAIELLRDTRPVPAPVGLNGLAKLSQQIGDKIDQLKHYRDEACQLEHARIIAEGRIIQAQQIQQWIAALSPDHRTEPAVNPSNPDRGEPVAWRELEPVLNSLMMAVWDQMAGLWESRPQPQRAALRARFKEIIEPLYSHPPVSAEREALEKAREALQAVVDVSKSGADTVSFLVDLSRVAKLCAAALSSTDGRSSAGQSDKLSNETVARALKAFQEAANSMVMCQRCNGTGYHHGFGEHGHDPDWCVVCGGCQSVAEFDDEGAMRKALEAVGACSIPVDSYKTEEKDEELKIWDDMVNCKNAELLIEHGLSEAMANQVISRWNEVCAQLRAEQARSDKLRQKLHDKLAQVEHYKQHECQLDHARAVAEGRIGQINQILVWMDEIAVSRSPAVSDNGGER